MLDRCLTPLLLQLLLLYLGGSVLFEGWFHKTQKEERREAIEQEEDRPIAPVPVVELTTYERPSKPSDAISDLEEPEKRPAVLRCRVQRCKLDEEGIPKTESDGVEGEEHYPLGNGWIYRPT